ncbi:mono/diheme cytochrome c family protein [Kroppenstedtia sanguinis]|uniref:Cytochrome c551 n=1 Tax=Kroppenstedtia eburnea TaxID=714067 RepID=A0A1N7ISL4_9BACL|nr:cytochrome c [Kroppenstedtia eburnea]EGK13811.1 cytochrome c-551 [Desmospora sp. 8437]QKI82153.1 cytochrome c [Kroppenstedtia eburnea]SIS40027.1 cytochrome c551 [Kroppenstedtia eburnea]
MKGYHFSKRKLLLTLLPLGLLFTGCTGEDTHPPSQPKKEPASAQIPDAYYTSCVNCHGDNLQGGYGPSLEKTGSKYSKKELESILDKGIGKMPAQRQIPKEDREKLAEWLSQLR